MTFTNFREKREEEMMMMTSENTDPQLADKYKVVDVIAKQRNSTILKAICRKHNDTVVIKAYENSKLTPMQSAQLHREITIHSQLEHPNIIALYEVITPTHTYLVMEYAEDGTLYDVLLRRPTRNFNETYFRSRVLRPLLSALHYLHNMHIAHRDIKLENVLVHKGHIKLADFGISINTKHERAVTRAGTLNYMSPEVLKHPLKRLPHENKHTHQGYTIKTDVWALGVLTYECLNGASPYATETKQQTEELIMQGSLPVFLNKLSTPDAIDFVYKCLTLDSTHRPDIQQLRKHPYVSHTTLVHDRKNHRNGRRSADL